MKHGRVPIGDGAVDKADVLVHAKSMAVKTNCHQYQSVLKENEELKETNDTLIEENSVHRDLLMVITLSSLPAINMSCPCIFILLFSFAEAICRFWKRATC